MDCKMIELEQKFITAFERRDFAFQEANINNVNWFSILREYKLSEEFICKYQDQGRFNWDNIFDSLF